ncbi:MAG: hypothetical protein ACTS3F_13515 [Phycisphaerales bacterium]
MPRTRHIASSASSPRTLALAAALGFALSAAAGVASAQQFIALSGRSYSAQGASGEWHYGGFNAAEEGQMYGFSSPRPPFTRAMLNRAMDRLNMDDAQREMVQSVHASLEQEYLSMWLEHTEGAADTRSNSMIQQDWTKFQQASEESARKYSDRVKALMDAFIADFELMLTPEQTAEWEAIERDRERGKQLARAADGSYQPVDLTVVVEGLELSHEERAALEPMLDRYREEIDAALSPALRAGEQVANLAREAQQIQFELMSMYQQETQDPQKMQELQEKQAEQGTKVVSAALDLRRMYDQVIAVQQRAVDSFRRELASQHHEDFDRATLQKGPSRGWNFANYSRFKIASQTLMNIEQARATMDMQMAMMGDAIDEQQGETVREMALLMRRAAPLTPEQRDRIQQIQARHEQRVEQLESEARSRQGGANDRDDQSHMVLAVPGGSLSLYRMSEDGMGRHMMGGADGDEAEIHAKKAEIEQDAINELRGILDFYQRALIANY